MTAKAWYRNPTDQFPNGSIICLESRDQEDAGYMLWQDIELADKTKDPDLIAEIRLLWDNEEWDDIITKARVEGSAWYVWWMDGVRAYMRRASAGDTSTDSTSETT